MNCRQLLVEAHSCWQEVAVCGREERSKGRSEATQAKFVKQEGGEVEGDPGERAREMLRNEDLDMGREKS